MEYDHEIMAAIALALHLHLSGEVHDEESGIITFEHSETDWNKCFLSFRKRPNK